jgi:hypothetical protein
VRTVAGHSRVVTCPCAQRPESRNAPTNTETYNQYRTSTRYNSINMDPIQAAIEELKSYELGDRLSYTKLAAKYDIDRSTLSRRHQGLQAPRETQASHQLNLSPQQELELVRYITKLTNQGLPPTRETIRNFSSGVAQQQLSESWVTRFINRHAIHLISKWTSAMDRTRHLADSESEYRLYFRAAASKDHRIPP